MYILHPTYPGTSYSSPSQDGTPSYTNPLSALFLVLFLTFRFPATLTNTVRPEMTRTMIAATVGTCPFVSSCRLLTGTGG